MRTMCHPDPATSVEIDRKHRERRTYESDSSPEHDDAAFDFPELGVDALVESSVLRNSWNFCLGLAAFLDFAAAIADRIDEPATPTDLLADPLAGKGSVVDFLLPEDTFLDDLLPRGDFVDSLLPWFRQKSFSFSIIFSLMWFIDAFIEAQRRRWETFQKIDKRRLLESAISESLSPKSYHDSPLLVYYSTVAIQLLLLPVGFYVFMCTYALWARDPIVFKLSTGEDDSDSDDDEEISSHAGISLIFAIMKMATITLARHTGFHFKRHLDSAVKRRIRRTLLFALRHPVQFSRRVRLFLYLLKWFKYIAPLVGALNKLKGNSADLLKKRRQQLEAGRAKIIRSKLWQSLPPDELRDYAALLIQSTFRAHQARKSLRALRLLQGDIESLAALKLQKQFRVILAKARARILTKRKEFIRLKAKQRKEKQHMNETERRRMYKLQMELNLETSDLLNRRLLLRPNTRFAVLWKIVFVSAVLFDIGQLAFKPMLSKHVDPSTGKPLGFAYVLEKKFVPRPILEHEQCIAKKQPRASQLLKLLLRQKTDKLLNKSQWYCQPTYVAIQASYRRGLKLLFHGFMDVISLICFLDVFVTFFTGEFDEKTGVLGPKPFFVRWILPGILLQLLVNPNVAGLSQILSSAGLGALRRGPVRVLRWTVSFFYPCFLFLASKVSSMWLQYIRKQNSSQSTSLVHL